MKKRILTFGAMAMLGVSALTGCGGSGTSNIKFGLILLHPHTESTYDKNFYDAVESASKEMGFKFVVRENIPEYDSKVTDTANELADEGCQIIFADSFGHEGKLMDAAKLHPEVTFLHATGYQAAGSGLTNFFDAFASIYEGRFLAGMAAGYKLKDMIEKDPTTSKNVGYVGAFNFSEVISGYTAWYLGVRKIVPDATMSVRYTMSWYDEAGEKAAAKSLIETDKCSIISQHADSYGAPTACEEAGVPNVSYNYSTLGAGPSTYLIASKIDWSAYIKHVVNAVVNKTQVTQDFVGTLENGGVKVLECSKNCPEGTQEKIDEAAQKIINKELKVFDTDTFTVDGQKLTSHIVNGNETIIDGEFKESKYASAPYIDFIIDGITEIK